MARATFDPLSGATFSGIISGQGVQPAPVAKTVSVTLTAAELLAGLITGNQGAAGAAAYQLPTVAAFEAALVAAAGALPARASWDFNVINLSAVAAEDITLTTNTGWTVTGGGSVVVQEGVSGAFRAVQTAAGAWQLYRLS